MGAHWNCLVEAILVSTHNIGFHEDITKTCPCNIERLSSEKKIENFIGKILIVLIFLLKTYIVGTR